MGRWRRCCLSSSPISIRRVLHVSVLITHVPATGWEEGLREAMADCWSCCAARCNPCRLLGLRPLPPAAHPSLLPPSQQITVPPSLARRYPGLSAVLAAAGNPSAPPSAPNHTSFRTLDHMPWAAYAKSNNGSSATAQIFEDLVVPGLQASMGWQTWRTAYGNFGPETCLYDAYESQNATCGIQPGGWASINIQNLSVPAGVPPPVDPWAAPPVTAWMR